MKKILISIFVIGALAFAFGADQKKTDDKIVRLSTAEWDAVKRCVDTNGYCRIAGQQTVIVITNGCPNVEYLLPVWNVDNDLERNKLKLKGRRGDKPPYREPMPYAGQSIW